MSNTLVFSNSVLKASLERLKMNEPIYLTFLERGNFDRNFIEDEKQWHNVEFAGKYWRLFADTFGSDAVESSTMELYDRLTFRAFTAAISLLYSAEAFFEKIPIWSNRVNHFNKYFFKVVGRGLGTTTGELVQDYLMVDDRALCSHMCLCSRGSIKGSLKAMGYKLISLKEIECIANGGQRCVYHFTWKNKFEIGPILLSVFFASILSLFFKNNLNLGTVSTSIFGVLTWLSMVFGYRFFALKGRLSEAVAFQDSAFKDYQELLYKHEALHEKLLEYQTELQNTFKLAQLGELSYGLLHDMATPIMSLGYSSGRMESLVQDNKIKSAELNSSIASIVKATRKLTNFQQNLRKVISGKNEKVACVLNPEDSIREVLDLLSYMQNRGGIKVTVNIDPNLKVVQCYEGYLERILLNLLTNSFKYLHQDREKIVMISAFLSGESYIIEVKDNGIGMDRSSLQHLTKGFVTSRESENVEIKGSGFGIFSVTKLIRTLEGDLNIESNIGVGTTMRVILPTELNAIKTGKDSGGQAG